jgi:sterol desaturase/sphingolipid hydroxylase (fatty acid hydroxylase superfamily)
MESLVRLGIAIGIFLIIISWELISPRRKIMISRKKRWTENLGLALFNIVLMRLSIGGLAYVSAIYSLEHHYGVLNLLSVPKYPAIIFSLLLLDFAIYCQHVVSHKWSVLWQLHQIHHSDMEFDATTAVRFHPLEIFISMLYKVACIFLIGATPDAVILFEIILNGAATFNHGNIKINPERDKLLRWFIITPDMHRIHHSTKASELNSNYGFSISVWDRLFNTYTANAEKPQTEMTIGLDYLRIPEKTGFFALLVLPFTKFMATMK